MLAKAASGKQMIKLIRGKASIQPFMSNSGKYEPKIRNNIQKA